MLRIAGASLLGAYLFWNAAWLCCGELAPSLCFGLAGLPGPTTGFTRGLVSLLRGDILESLRYNAFAVPILVLIGTSFVWLAILLMRRRRPLLPSGFYWTWLGLLLLSWFGKLLGSPDYW